MLIQEGEYLCLEGDKANSLYIVKEGMLVGTCRHNKSEQIKNFGPGSIIGEFSLLESSPREYTIKAAEDSEITTVSQDNLHAILEQHPSWLKSIINFLTSRFHIAQQNKRKNDLIQALPSLLFVFSSSLKKTGNDSISLNELEEKLLILNNTPAEETKRLLEILEELNLLKIQGNKVYTEFLQIIPLLYETLRYRALNKKVSPNILSMTDQMILTVFVKLARESKTPLKNSICTIPTESLIKEVKKSMHGVTLTARTLSSLVEKKILEPSQSFDIHTPLESISFLYADFDKILDLLELNRIFPLLDKKLIQ